MNRNKETIPMNTKRDIASIRKEASEALIHSRQEIVNYVRGHQAGTGALRETTCEKIINHIVKSVKGRHPAAEFGDVYIGICLLMQLGGTSPRQPDDKNMPVRGGMVTLKEIRKQCKDNKATVRQFARSICNDIGQLMERIGEGAPEGNLARAMRAEMTELSHAHAIWASDFQTFNPNCPDIVRSWLTVDYRKKFRKTK
jgi:hypothetical protein